MPSSFRYNLPERPPTRPAIHTFEDFASHITNEVASRLLSKGYYPIFLGGGITGE
jgi:hypothetical protein